MSINEYPARVFELMTSISGISRSLVSSGSLMRLSTRSAVAPGKKVDTPPQRLVIVGSSWRARVASDIPPTTMMNKRWGGVSTFLPGATAERVESLISELSSASTSTNISAVALRNRPAAFLVSVGYGDVTDP